METRSLDYTSDNPKHVPSTPSDPVFSEEKLKELTSMGFADEDPGCDAGPWSG